MHYIVLFVQTRIQSSHRKVDAATSDMRAYSDSMTVMTYLNEESRTGIFTRTYGLQGIVAEIEEKRLLKARGIVVFYMCCTVLSAEIPHAMYSETCLM